MLGLEHVIRLAAKQSANGAVAGGDEERALAVGQNHRRSGEHPVGLELDPDLHDQLLRILCAGGYGPQLREPCAQRVEFARR